jgi:CubicO group peptidase (beta-lactamase class C family)
VAFGAALVHAAHAPGRSDDPNRDERISTRDRHEPSIPDSPLSAASAAAASGQADPAGPAQAPLGSEQSDAAQDPESNLLRELPEVDALMARALRSKKTPGAVVVAGRRSGVVFRRAYGYRAIVPDRLPMTTDTVFDLASLSKPLVVGTLVQWLIEQGKLKLEDSVASRLPEFGARGKQNLTVEQLLLHTSGLPPTNTLHDYRGSEERALQRTLRSWPEALPGRRFIYSDVGFIALGEMIERILGEQLDRAAQRVIFSSLGMTDTRYCPTMCDDDRIAPTELNYGWTRSPIRGEVNDPRAYKLGGVAGNAGVFSTGDDLARFARMLLGRGELDGKRVLSEASVERFTTPRAVPGATRALAWDVSSGFSTARGRRLSERAYGHGGSTGTSLWIDPERDLFVVFLSNRNHPWGRGKVLELQGEIADAVAAALNPDDVSAEAHAAAETPHAAIAGDGAERRPDELGGG